MADRRKFKEALNDLSSPQRTALLYLERLILDSKPVTITLPSRTVDLKPLEQKMKVLNKQFIRFIKSQEKPYKKAIKELDDDIRKFNEAKSKNYDAMAILAENFEEIGETFEYNYDSALKHLSRLTGVEFQSLANLSRGARRDPDLMTKVKKILDKKP